LRPSARRQVSRKSDEQLRALYARLGRSIAAELPDAKVYLVGSRARGDWLEDSDIDLLVVSKGFRGLDIGQRYALIRKHTPTGLSLDALTYTPDEFRAARKRSSILEDMLEDALPIT
jgi:predicted nucleotidyltransferase